MFGRECASTQASHRAHNWVGALVLTCALGAAAAGARSEPSDQDVLPAYQMLYSSTIRCFAANGLLVGDLRKAGQTAKAAAYEWKAKQSFDMGFQAGRKIGLSDSRIQSDFDGARATELPKLMQDDAYFDKATKECKALGLM